MEPIKHVVVPVADGFEEIEAVVIVDILRRAGIRVTMPGSKRLCESDSVTRLLRQMSLRGKLLGAICAAPTVLHAAGLLGGRRATSHPAHASEMTDCHYLEEPVVSDGSIVTSRGAGTAIEFAATIVSHLVGSAAAGDILDAIQYRR